jgi:citrate/tricarballylate utilization protein
MPPADLLRHGEHVMTVCNSCRYCEAYCPVFPAMEERLVFKKADLAYLANLCHNCGECLYACQYAPPHEFGINVPRTLAEIRLASYQDLCWPRVLGVAFRRHSLVTSLTFAISLIALMVAGGSPVSTPAFGGDFYRVLPHDRLVGIFGGVFLFVITALIVGLLRFWRLTEEGPAALPVSGAALASALGDALTLRHLHSGDARVDCTGSEGSRSPLRRWFHHATMYGYLFCFASTSVAAVYHAWFGWYAPYSYTSLPVVLGTIGGIGLLVGPAGLIALKQDRDEAVSDPAQRGLDTTFIALLFLTSLTGLLLLIMRDRSAMGVLLVVHLAFVLTLFITMPYGKFVHGVFRAAALVKFALEKSRGDARSGDAVPD